RFGQIGCHQRAAARRHFQEPAASFSEYASHKVAKNETLQQISRKYGISMTALLKVNSLHSSKLKAGQMLRVPMSSGTEQLALVKPSQPAFAAADKAAAAEKITYKLKKGETLSEVADKYDVSLTALMKWNSISKAAKVKAGQELTVHAEQKGVQIAAAEPAAESKIVATADVGIVELTAVNVKQKSSVAAILHQAALTKKARTTVVMELSGGKKQKAGKRKEDAVSYYKVRNGDSLWSISKKLQISAKEIKSWNRLGDQAIRPGLTLVIKNG
ncbi:LysM peptidoglycan-binding domain-containing protein, partial [Desulfobulbus sp. F3]|nr:LysM peptidoglycan-binding domain-containing protein [Desulfobulbus sp. F3]